MKDKKCPNPNGEPGICYNFDRFGDRCGCVGCELLETLPNGMMNESNPLPGLAKQLKVEKYKPNTVKIKLVIEELGVKIVLNTNTNEDAIWNLYEEIRCILEKKNIYFKLYVKKPGLFKRYERMYTINDLK